MNLSHHLDFAPSTWVGPGVEARPRRQVVGSLLIPFVLVALLAAKAGAIPNYAAIYKEKTKYLPACIACHNQDDWELNDFGESFEHGTRDVASLTALGDKDPDGDGASNAAEFEAKSNPGDARSKPGKAGKWLDDAALHPPTKILRMAFPGADGFDVQELSLSDASVKALEKRLAGRLPDESRYAPVFEASIDEKRAGLGVYISVDLPGSKHPTFAFVCSDKPGVLSYLKMIDYSGSKSLKKEDAWTALLGKSAEQLLKGVDVKGPVEEVKAFRAAVARGVLTLQEAWGKR